MTAGQSLLAAETLKRAPYVLSGGSKLNTAGIMGDSFGSRHSSTTGTPGSAGYAQYSDACFGVLWPAFARLRGRLSMVLNTSVSGTRMDQWISGQLSAMVASAPAWVFLMPPTNDREQGIALSTSQANFITIVDALQAVGSRIVALGLCPEAAGSVGTTMTSAKQTYTVQWNHWIKGLQATRRGFYAVDGFNQISDGGTGFAAATAKWTPDNLHLSNWSVWRIGKLYADLLDPLVPDIDLRTLGSMDVPGLAGTSPNLVASSGIHGSAGFKSNGAVGTVATGFTVGSSGGVALAGTVTCSVVSPTDQLQSSWQQVVVTTAASDVRCSQSGINTGYTAGTTIVRPEVEIDTDADISSVTRLSLAASFAVPGGAIETRWAYQPTAGDYPIENRLTADLRGRYPILIGPSMVVPATTTSITWYLDFSGLGTFRFRYPGIRANPQF